MQLTGTIAAKSQTVSLTPTYTGCTLAGITATVNMNGCTFTMEAGIEVGGGGESLGGMTIVCPGENQIVITINLCQIKIPGSEPVGFVDYKNVLQELEIGFDAAFFNYSLNNKCLAAEGEYQDGSLKGKSMVKGNNGQFGVVP